MTEALAPLAPHPAVPAPAGPVLLVILDGVGLYRGRADGYDANAVEAADTPVLDRLLGERVFTPLRAHGTAVGMPSDDDMGNSEVGHNALGAGRVFDQGAKLVAAAIADGRLFRSPAWVRLVGRVLERRSALHFIGLLSDGNVHSHIAHLEAMIDEAHALGVERLFVHALLDGRDVPKQSAEVYLTRLEARLTAIRAAGTRAAPRAYYIASGGGRMTITMDRYEADWPMVARGWRVHVHGESPDGRWFPDALTALAALRADDPGRGDQDLPAFVIHRPDHRRRAVGPVADGDAVIFFNFRGDRAIEISRAFTECPFAKFDRGGVPDVLYAGMMEYDGDTHIPPRYLVAPPAITGTIGAYLAATGVPSYAISETQKYGHVTYFWNGNNSAPFDPALETWEEVPSRNVPFVEQPAMQAEAVTDRLIAALTSGRYRFLRVNYANGDMIGHTGSFEAAVQAMETVDRCLGRLLAAAETAGATVVLLADHGNADQMADVDKKTGRALRDATGAFVPRTSHTLSPVPFVVVGPQAERVEIDPAAPAPGLGNVAATLLTLMGFAPPASYLPSVVRPRAVPET